MPTGLPVSTTAIVEDLRDPDILIRSRATEGAPARLGLSALALGVAASPRRAFVRATRRRSLFTFRDELVVATRRGRLSPGHGDGDVVAVELEASYAYSEWEQSARRQSPDPEGALWLYFFRLQGLLMLFPLGAFRF